MNIIKFLLGAIILITTALFVHMTPDAKLFPMIFIREMIFIGVLITISFYAMTKGCLEYCK
jgi:hypothetical protein